MQKVQVENIDGDEVFWCRLDLPRQEISCSAMMQFNREAPDTSEVVVERLCSNWERPSKRSIYENG